MCVASSGHRTLSALVAGLFCDSHLRLAGHGWSCADEAAVLMKTAYYYRYSQISLEAWLAKGMRRLTTHYPDFEEYGCGPDQLH